MSNKQLERESAKKDSQVVSLIALLGSLNVKDARRALMKMTPGVCLI